MSSKVWAIAKFMEKPNNKNISARYEMSRMEKVHFDPRTYYPTTVFQNFGCSEEVSLTYSY